MAYILEISQRDISRYAEECPFKNEEGHNIEGTGDECAPECLWLDGDVREIQDYGTHAIEMDDQDRKDYGTPVAWAAYYLSKHHSEVTHGPEEETPKEDQWIDGTSNHPYKDEERETTVYIKGDFTDIERGQIFKLAKMPYHQMTSTLQEWGL